MLSRKKKKKKNIQRLKQRGRNNYTIILVYTHSVILVIQAIGLVRYLGLCYKAEQNRCRELGVLPKIHGKNVLKIQKYPRVMTLKVRKDFMLLNSVIIVKWFTVADFL